MASQYPYPMLKFRFVIICFAQLVIFVTNLVIFRDSNRAILSVFNIIFCIELSCEWVGGLVNSWNVFTFQCCYGNIFGSVMVTSWKLQELNFQI